MKKLLSPLRDLRTNLIYETNKKRIRAQIGPPIFIVGCGHSGTTLLLKILNSHSKIHGIPQESRLFFTQGKETKLKEFNLETLEKGKLSWVEKTPRHIYHIAEILDRWQDTRIIYIIRDGRDVAVSMTRRGCSLEEGIQRWVKDNSAILPFLGNNNVLKTHYEDLVADFQNETTKILTFLGFQYEYQLDEFYKSDIPLFRENNPESKDFEHRKRRISQLNQPLKNYNGEWQLLSIEDQKLLEDLGGDLLKRFGYLDGSNPDKR